jgi:hypothetical protein
VAAVVDQRAVVLEPAPTAAAGVRPVYGLVEHVRGARGDRFYLKPMWTLGVGG